LQYLSEAVDTKNSLIGPCFGIVDYVEVDELLELYASGLHVLDDVHEQYRHVFSTCHGVDDLLKGGGYPSHSLKLQLLAVGIELILQLLNLAYLLLSHPVFKLYDWNDTRTKLCQALKVRISLMSRSVRSRGACS